MINIPLDEPVNQVCLVCHAWPPGKIPVENHLTHVNSRMAPCPCHVVSLVTIKPSPSPSSLDLAVCHRWILNISPEQSPLKFTLENPRPHPHVTGLGRGALEEVVRSEGRAPMNEIGDLIKESPESSPASFHHVRTRKENSHL